MKVKELIEKLQECDPDVDVFIEQTNDDGEEGVSQVVEYGLYGARVVLEGDLFQ